MSDRLSVVELAMYLPLPYAGAFFANMGAKVTKIENPKGGDPLKSLDKRAYDTLNRKKKIRYFDLKNRDEIDKIRKLILEADIVLNGFRRGLLDKIGLGYSEIKEKNPGVIYINLAGYEKDMSIGGKAGHDLNFMGLSGIMPSFSGAQGPLPFQAADMSGALWAIIGALSMLNNRKTTGKGAELDLSLFRSALSFFPFFYFCEETGNIDKGLFRGKSACYNVYKCKDNKDIAVGSLEEKFFKRLLEILGIAFDGNRIDLNGQGKLINRVKKAFMSKASSYWLKKFEKEDICVSPVYNREEFYSFMEKEGVQKNTREDFLLFPVNQRKLFKKG
jgi:alpha-methylacyl-CoA racemase